MENNEENKNMESTAESVQNVETSKVEETKEEKTFTRDEVNKMINAEKQKERQAVINEYETKKAEAEKLAKMDEDQKKLYELQQITERANKAEKALNAYKLKDETIRQASQKGIPLDLIQTLDFEIESAESIASKLAIFEKTSNSVREKAISEYSKEEPPQTGEKVDGADFSKMTYSQIAEYLEKHPNAKI
jgi:hypothetical protein